jgi:hypothetical protein
MSDPDPVGINFSGAVEQAPVYQTRSIAASAWPCLCSSLCYSATHRGGAVRLGRLISLLPMLALFSAATALAQTSSGAPAGKSLTEVRDLKVTILSTMLADDGIGEWGFAALVEADGHKILYDTGARPNTVLENARELRIDLSGVQSLSCRPHHRTDDSSARIVTQQSCCAFARACRARNFSEPPPGKR